MKKSLQIFALLFCIIISAQAPEKFSYQAIIRNASNALVTNASVGMKISILKTSAAGTVVYSETQTVNTNANGLVTLQIGSGTVLTGTISGINWSNDSYYIKTETDPGGGNSYTIAGTSQLLSVPYAMYSKSSGSGGSESVGITASGLTTNLIVLDNTWTTINKWANLQEDGGANYNPATGEYTITKNGVYQINAQVSFNGYSAPGTYIALRINTNYTGSVAGMMAVASNPAGGGAAVASPNLAIAHRFVAGDKVTIDVAQSSGVDQTVSSTIYANQMSIQYLHK